MASKKEIEELAEKARGQGWRVERTAKGHWTFLPADKALSPVVHSGTSGDWRAILNFKARLKQRGFKFDGLSGAACEGGRSDPALWEGAKRDAQRSACSHSPARCGTWDARIAQDAGRRYRAAGGRYCGPRTPAQKSLKKWTREDWRTATGEPACRGSRCDRYLPAAAWESLSPQEIAATRRKKLRGRGQFVPNTPAARRAGARARALGRSPQGNNTLWIVGGLILVGVAVAASSKTIRQRVSNFAFSLNDPTDKVIASLATAFQPIAMQFVQKAREAGYRVVLASGTRTVGEQEALYAQGRTAPGKIVTNARGGESAHNFGLAFDFAFGDSLGRPTWPENGPWAAAAAIGKQLGMEWGGDWTTLKDRPHLEMPGWRAIRAAWRQSGAKDYAIA